MPATHQLGGLGLSGRRIQRFSKWISCSLNRTQDTRTPTANIKDDAQHAMAHVVPQHVGPW